MFQISSSGGSANFRHENEREAVNSKIELFQQNHGVCDSFKQLFERLLEVANGHQETVKTVEVYPENALYIGKSKEDFHEFNEKVKEFREKSEFPADLPLQDVITRAFWIASQPKPSAEIKEIPAEIPENALVIEFTDHPNRPAARKLEILKYIQENRQKKYRFQEPENLSSVVENLIFSEGALYNHGGDVFTGL